MPADGVAVTVLQLQEVSRHHLGRRHNYSRRSCTCCAFRVSCISSGRRLLPATTEAVEPFSFAPFSSHAVDYGFLELPQLAAR